MRQYYDVYCLLENPEVQDFIGTAEYEKHKLVRFPSQDLIAPLLENEAFLLSNPSIRAEYRKRYESTKALYYNTQPDFEDVLEKIRKHLNRL